MTVTTSERHVGLTYQALFDHLQRLLEDTTGTAQINMDCALCAEIVRRLQLPLGDTDAA